ncbi:hypothetical protein [Halapricum desulfuricans]|uniref:Uncharacterized protein n=1 Tax=Halapricum desulfuricans TaxID=2841257 RepID=A0A897MWL4_9EURY|nr:hypothetical protein [Halapricum desulfuricans]QSG04982.1 Uncharacterized protein HSR121_0627 [Halapricum desulfuricans]
MAVRASHTDVTVTVTLWVHRDAGSDLQRSVESVLGAVEGVDAVTVRNVTGVQPRSTDIRVTVVADMAVAVSGDQTVSETLVDGFGVMDVDRCTLKT